MPPPAAPPPAATLTVATGRQSQLATLHCPGRTASIAGASIGQALLNRRCSSEGTVQVVVTAPGMPTSPRIPATAGTACGGHGGAALNNANPAAPAPAAASQDNNNTAQPANSAADNRRGGGASRLFENNNRNGAGRGRGGIDPEDSTTAISHAPGAGVAATARGAIALDNADGRGGDNGGTPSVAVAIAPAARPTAAAAAAAAAAKPTDSYSSAAVNAVPHAGERGHDRAGGGGGAAASLASHHHHNDNDQGAGGSLNLENAAVDFEIRQAIDMPAPPLPSATQPQQHNNQQPQQPATAVAAAPVTAAATMLTPASRMGNGVLLTPGHGLTPLQIQSVVSAALGRAGPLTARPGDSSSSGNRPLVLVGLKRKKPPTGGVGRPPMAPPAQVPRTHANNNNNHHQGATTGQAQPTASSPGFAPQQADNTLAVEDAVSMVEHGLETADIEVACDAVSKASQGEVEDFGGTVDGDVDGGFIGSGCPSLAGPGVSLASAG
jgi:hypothetical protein